MESHDLIPVSVSLPEFYNILHGMHDGEFFVRPWYSPLGLLHTFSHFLLCCVSLVDASGGSWGPKETSLCPADYLKAANLGQKISMGLEAAYQVQRIY